MPDHPTITADLYHLACVDVTGEPLTAFYARTVTIDGHTTHSNRNNIARPIVMAIPDEATGNRTWQYRHGAPIREDLWLTEGVIVDEDNRRYGRNGGDIGGWE